MPTAASAGAIIELLYWNPITMAERSAELLKGALDLLILRVLDLNAMHGSAIADRVAQITKGTFQVKAGSLFPALHRLEQRVTRVRDEDVPHVFIPYHIYPTEMSLAIKTRQTAASPGPAIRRT